MKIEKITRAIFCSRFAVRSAALRVFEPMALRLSQRGGYGERGGR